MNHAKLRLGTKITLWTACPLLMLVAWSGVALGRNIDRDHVASRIDVGEAILRQVVSRIRVDLELEDDFRVSETLRSVGGDTVDLQAIEVAMPGVPDFAHWSTKTPAEHTQKLSREVRDGDLVLGTVRIVMGIDSSIAHARERWRDLIVLLAVAVILVASISFVVGSVIGRRFRTLESVVEGVSRGDYSTRAREGGDEIGRLAFTLNRMAETIDSQQSSLEESILEAQRQAIVAVDASVAKSEFLANMSHELRTPLHGILSFACFGVEADDGADPRDLNRYFERIEQSGQVLLSLLNTLLDLSKLESGRSQFDCQPQLLPGLIASILEEFEAMTEARGIAIRFAADAADAETTVVVDHERISQVMRNLVGNAVKFSHEDSCIDIELWFERTDRVVRISVKDRGPGIPEAELKSVFDKFYQSSKTKTGAGGTGLGLAICAEIVALHEGRIWAENRAGGGAVIIAELPLDSVQSTRPPIDMSSVPVGVPSEQMITLG